MTKGNSFSTNLNKMRSKKKEASVALNPAGTSCSL